MRFIPAAPAPDLDQVHHAWDEFVQGRPEALSQVRPHVRHAWERSARSGCDPRTMRADLLSPAETAALLRDERRLIEVASPFMETLSRAAAGERHAAMLSDGAGRVLKIVGDEETVADPNFPRAGTLLSEATAGANGIGTTLAEGRYVELVGPEHFIEGFHAFTCQGVPLLGNGLTTSGVLSTSVRRLDTSQRLRDILFCGSEAAECELLASWLSDALVGGDDLSTALEQLREDMVQRLAAARLQIELAARRIASGADASEMVRGIEQLSRKFRRQAATWRHLVEDRPVAPEPLLLGDLVEDLADLLGTEATIVSTTIAWRRTDRVLVSAPRRTLSQELLGAFLNAMHVAAPGSEILVDVSNRGHLGTVVLTATLPTGAAAQFRTEAPVLT